MLTGRTQIPAEVNNFYSRTLLERSIPSYLHNRFAEVRDLPAKAGTDTMKFRKYGSLAAATTPLTAGVTPAGNQLSTTTITAQILQYGDYVTTDDVVNLETKDPLLTELATILGEQSGNTLDQLCRDVIVAGTTVQYASTATARSEVSSTMLINRDEIMQGVRTLQGNNAKVVTSMIDTSTGYNSKSVAKSFIGICSNKTLFDLKKATGWTPVKDYASKGDVMEDEKGALDEVRFLMTTNAKVFASAGAGSIDVHATLIIGRRAYAQSRISGAAMENIVKPLGSGGTQDPLNQRATSGWKATYVAIILQQGWLLRIEHAVSS